MTTPPEALPTADHPMAERTPGGGGRIKARPAGLLSPVTKLPIFRIEDATGRVLRRIGSARTAGEAIAHYWRGTVADARLAVAMSDEPPADAALRRRIDRARAARGPAGRAAMRTHELPVPAPDADEAMAAPRATRSTAGRRRPASASSAEQDLFAVPGDPEPVPVPEPVPEAMPEPVPELEAVPAAEQLPAEQRPADVEPELEPEPRPEPKTSYHLDPQQVSLQPVDHRNLRPTDRADSYLYHISNRAEADNALQNGLAVSAHDPIILTERQGVAYWLSVLAEDYDVILDGPVDFVVLRVRRHAVEELLEPDPDASRSAGCACFLLTGGASAQG